jgi:uncharacterized tellurite resistance protein B-like protein
MFKPLTNWIHGILENAENERSFTGDDHRLAVAALLVHLIAVDGVITEDERKRLREVLSKHFELDAGDTERLVAEARRRDEDAVDLYGFTSVLKRMLDEPGRAQVVEMMWQLVFADGKISEFEDNMVWRVAELLAVSPRERIALKRKVEANLGAS